MRSILLEASSIERALDKAWNEANKPREFTIKIHDEGERNFLGFARRPARLSIIYVPSKTKDGQSQARSADKAQGRGRDRQERAPHSDRRSTQSVAGGDEVRGRRPIPPKPMHRTAPIEEVDHVVQLDWRGEWEKYVVSAVRDIVRLVGITVPFETLHEDKCITITFKQAVLPDADEQHMFFASLSYLSIQFLKRHYKQRFMGYRVLVTCIGAQKADDGEVVAEAGNERVERVHSQPRPERVERTERSSERTERPERTASDRGERSERSDRSERPERGERSDRGDRRRGGRSSDRRRSEPRVYTEQAAEDNIVSEQIRFAQQEMAKERAQGVHNAPEEHSSAPVVQSSPPAAPAGKYQRFYVLPEAGAASGDDNKDGGTEQ